MVPTEWLLYSLRVLDRREKYGLRMETLVNIANYFITYRLDRLMGMTDQGGAGCKKEVK
jgi:hypothetical protein